MLVVRRYLLNERGILLIIVLDVLLAHARKGKINQRAFVIEKRRCQCNKQEYAYPLHIGTNKSFPLDDKRFPTLYITITYVPCSRVREGCNPCSSSPC